MNKSTIIMEDDVTKIMVENENGGSKVVYAKDKISISSIGIEPIKIICES